MLTRTFGISGCPKRDMAPHCTTEAPAQWPQARLQGLGAASTA